MFESPSTMKLGEWKGSDMISTKLAFHPIFCMPVSISHHSCVIDEDIDVVAIDANFFCDLLDLCLGRKIESEQADSNTKKIATPRTTALVVLRFVAPLSGHDRLV
jgi:hypothetical protein